MTKKNGTIATPLSRRHLLHAAVATGAGLGTLSIGGFTFVPAFAEDQPPLGTWPAGSQGSTVTIGATVPRTGAYAVQGEDELKGMQLAVEHINEARPLIKKIAPKINKGVLGKQVKLVRRRLRRQAERRGAGATDLHQRQQDRRHDRLDLDARSRWRSTSSPSARRSSTWWRSPAPTTPPARTARATASASASTARPRPTRSARCW